MYSVNGLAGKKVVVTGGSGFIGTNLVPALQKCGALVTNIDKARPRCLSQSDAWRHISIMDEVGLRECVAAAAPQVVIHLAARTDMNGTALDQYAENSHGVSNLLAALRVVPSVERVVFASSRLVCRIDDIPKAEDVYSATTPYGRSKAEGERIVRRGAVGYSWVIVRPTSIWGPWFDVPYRGFFSAIKRGRYMHPRGAGIRKSYGYVKNTVHQVLALAADPSRAGHGQTMYLADYEPLDVLEWACSIADAFGVPKVRQFPVAALKALARIGDCAKLCGMANPPLTTFRLSNLLTNMVHDTSPIRKIAGPLPYTLRQGVAETVDWMQSSERNAAMVNTEV